jgi:2-C-methyl-D-erythritol 4-phosphate cytidylyltransferase
MSPHHSKYTVIIPAAGQGSRIGAGIPKALLSLPQGSCTGLKRTIVGLTVSVFEHDAACEAILVCVPPLWREQFAQALRGSAKVVIVEGGETRQESVYRAVLKLSEVSYKPSLDRVVLVHDAARCCLAQALVGDVVAGVAQYGAVTAAIPVSDALSRVTAGALEESVSREALWSIQTPQGFLLSDLRDAHQEAALSAVSAPDDATLVARRRSVHVVHGDRLNIKVTHPDDLRVAGLIVGG